MILGAALLVLAGLATGALVGATPDADAVGEDWADALAGSAGIATLFALIYGVMLISGEYRHGTITWTFLATPRRAHVAELKRITGG